jgi:hypothetical protein
MSQIFSFALVSLLAINLVSSLHANTPPVDPPSPSSKGYIETNY